MKKRFVGLLAAGMLAATLAGCGGSTEETTAANAAAGTTAEEGAETSGENTDSPEGK